MTTDIKKYYFKEGLPQEFEIIKMEQLFYSIKDAMTKVHRINFNQILWFQNGSPTHFVDFVPIEIKPNTILLVKKNSVQQFDKHKPFQGEMILFTDDFFCRTENDVKFLKHSIFFNDLFSTSKIQLPHNSKSFDELLLLMTEESALLQDEVQSFILQNLLKTFILKCEREKRKQDDVKRERGIDFEYVMLFNDVLEANYNTQKQVSFYVKKIFISEKKLNFSTKKILGKTPKELIDDRVTLEAKRLLAHSTESVKEIGYTLGFDEPTNFIKYFKKHTLKTPLEFREKNQLD